MRIIFSFFLFSLSYLSFSVASELDDFLHEQNNNFKKSENYYREGVFRFIDRFSDNKKIIKLKVSKDNSYYIGDFKVKILKCWKAPKSQEKENAAAVEIFEKNAKAYNKIFSGWLFSNNFFLTNIEHSRYDLRLIDCTN